MYTKRLTLAPKHIDGSYLLTSMERIDGGRNNGLLAGLGAGG